MLLTSKPKADNAVGANLEELHTLDEGFKSAIGRYSYYIMLAFYIVACVTFHCSCGLKRLVEDCYMTI